MSETRLSRVALAAAATALWAGLASAAPAQQLSPAPAITAPDGKVAVLPTRPQRVEGAPGERVEIVFAFEVEQAPGRDLALFVHFIGEDGAMARFQADHRPAPGTATWRGGVEDRRVLTLPVDMKPGDYRIRVGLFDPRLQGYDARLDLKPRDGVGAGEETKAYDVGVLHVKPPPNAPERPASTNAANNAPRGGSTSADPLDGAAYNDDHARQLGFTRLTFHDEFNGPSLSTKAWANTFAWGDRTLAGNGERQCYLERNVSVSGGLLRLAAKRETVTCPKHERVMDVTSGMVASLNSFGQLYGYFAARIKAPSGKGLWPAFWLLPVDGRWPPEIDILEAPKSPPTSFFTTYHFNDEKGEHKSEGKEVATADLSKDFHVYAIAWEPGAIRWYLDGAQVFETRRLVMDKPAYMLLNLAVGGYWPGDPDASTPFPSEMLVDWVRVYSK